MDKKTTDGMVLISKPEGGRRPNEGSETGGKVIKFWAKHKIDGVMSLMRGKTL